MIGSHAELRIWSAIPRVRHRLRAGTPALVALALATLMLACGADDEATSASSSAATGDTGAGLDIPPPAPPAPPVFVDWTCPKGWLAEPVLAGMPQEHSICAPPPLPESCPHGMMPVIGEAECQLIGDPCPVDEWPAGLPGTGTILYVKAGATGGDGSSKGAPLGSIGAAVKAAPKGAVIAIAKGVYAESVTIAKSLTLWGACAAAVTIQGPAGGSVVDATIEVLAPGDLVVRNLEVTGPRMGIYVDYGAELEAEGVLVRKARGVGVAALGGSAVLSGVVVAETAAFPNGTYGVGLDAEDGAQVHVQRALFEKNRKHGVYGSDATTELTLSGVVVRDTRSQKSDAQFGRGLGLQEGARATVERALFQRNRDLGVYASDGGTELTLTDAIVEATQRQENDERRGRGLALQDGARATIARAVFEKNRDAGVFASGADTELTLTDAVVRDTQSEDSTQRFGEGLVLRDGAKATVERAAFSNNRYVSVVASGAGTELTLADAVVVDTQSQEGDKQLGCGLVLQDGAHAAVERTVFERNRAVGVSAAGANTELAVADAVVRDTYSQESNRRFGRGLSLQEGAHATVERGVFERNRANGVLALGTGTELTLDDVLVNDTQFRDDNQEDGVGVAIVAGASLQVERSRIAGSRVAGLFAQNGGRITVSRCEVVGTQTGSVTLVGPDGNTISGPHYDDLADGILVVGGSSATLDGVRVASCSRAGILFDESSGTLDAVTSAGNRFGLVLQQSPSATYDEATCDFTGNHEASVVPDGDLPVPNAPLDLPETP